MTDTDRLLSCLSRLEQTKSDWDDKKREEIQRDCLTPLTRTCMQMQETERAVFAMIFSAEHRLRQIEEGLY